MTRRFGISEMLKMINDLPTEIQRQDSLGTCVDNHVMIGMLKYIFDPNIEFDLPSGEPPYKINEYVNQEGNLYPEFRKMYLFIKDGQPNLTGMKREVLFIQMIESLHPDDAKLVIAMKDKICPYPNITYNLVYKTFPGLLPPPQEVKKVNTITEPKVQAKGPGARNEDLERACPFGCISAGGKQYYMPGPLVAHLKKQHNYTQDQVDQFKKEQYS